MTDGSSVPHEQGPPPLGSSPRAWILVSCLVTVAVVVIAVAVAETGVWPESSSTQSSFPGGNVTGVLFYGQVQTPGTYYEGQFTVPPIFGPNVSVKVELVALVNVSCGGASPYLIGADFNCLISLISGPTGGPTEDLLWTESFTGYVASNVSLLPPGFYSFLVHVVAGTAPEGVLIVPFTATLEAATLS